MIHLLINIHLLDLGSLTLTLDVHLLDISLLGLGLLVLLGWLLLLLLRSWLDLCPRLGLVHDRCASVDDIFSALVDLGRGDDGVDVLGLLVLSVELVIEPLLGGGTLLDLYVSYVNEYNEEGKPCSSGTRYEGDNVTHHLGLVCLVDVRVLLVTTLCQLEVHI
jgi:hypothetical protein